MIAGYYRIRILLQDSHAERHTALHTGNYMYMCEGLAQGPYVADRVGFEPATFRTEGTEHHHLATTPRKRSVAVDMKTRHNYRSRC